MYKIVFRHLLIDYILEHAKVISGFDGRNKNSNRKFGKLAFLGCFLTVFVSAIELRDFWVLMRLDCNSQRCFTQPRVYGRGCFVDGVFNIRHSQMLTGGAVNRNLVTLFETVVLEQRINTNCEVELDEEEEDAELRYLQAEEHSDDSEYECKD